MPRSKLVQMGPVRPSKRRAPSVWQKIIRRLKPQTLPNLLGAQGLCDLRVAGSTCLPYVGAVGISNLGDEIMFEVARRSFPRRRLVAAKYKPILQRHVLDRCIEKGLCLLVGGGTAILSDSLLLTLERSARTRIPFVTFGTGVLDPEYWGKVDERKRDRWLRVFELCQELGVRGPLSKDILEGLGVKNAQVVGDPGVLYTRKDFMKPVADKILGVNVGTSNGRVWGGDEHQPVLKLAEALASLQRNGWRCRFFCVWPRDLPTIQRVIAHAGLRNAEVVQEYYSAERFLGEVSACRVFVGMKLHAVVLSVCAGVATLALEYRPKLRDFMASIQSESEVVRFDQYDAPHLESVVLNLAEHAEAVSCRQWQANRQLCEQFSSYVERIRSHVFRKSVK